MLISNLCDKRFNYEFEKLSRLFFPFERIDVVNEAKESERYAVLSASESNGNTVLSAFVSLNGNIAEESAGEKAGMELSGSDTERMLSVCLFKCLCRLTGYTPAWGILTGVRPASLFSRTVKACGLEKAKEYFSRDLLVSNEKISLCEETYLREEEIISLSAEKDISLYISVPFCPSRCSYCSFVSHSVESAAKLIPDYVDKLCEELRITADIVKNAGLKLKTVYMGGGTPTTLDAVQLTAVFDALRSNFDMSGVVEFTVEAGRPDTITYEKLLAIKSAGATRISINPQTMNDKVLERIGRKHTSKQTEEAFKLARSCGFDNINTDLIAGLPSDDLESFKNTLERIKELDPESVTVHALSMKRASDLNQKEKFSGSAEFASDAVNYAREFLENNGIKPYYMYRQSKTVGNLENVGYAKKGYEGYYNVYIMDETHTILAVGASAVTKLRGKSRNDIKRIFNYKYPYEYINRFAEQTARKEEVVRFYEKNT